MIDLDHFKQINDSAGHAAGDAALCAVAKTLTARMRIRDLAARLGGDEFAVVLEHCPLDAALRLAADLTAAIGAMQASGADRRAASARASVSPHWGRRRRTSPPG